MHKKMQALSALCRRKGRSRRSRAAPSAGPSATTPTGTACSGAVPPAPARRDLAGAGAGRRRSCAGAKASRGRFSISTATGTTEIWVHSDSFSALVSPAAAPRVEEYTVFRERHQLRQRAHPAAGGLPRPGAGARRGGPAHGTGGTASIHDIEAGHPARRAPAVDADDRALLIERILPAQSRLGPVRRGRLPAGAFLGPHAVPLRGAAAAGSSGDRLRDRPGHRSARQAHPLRRAMERSPCATPGMRRPAPPDDRLLHRALARRTLWNRFARRPRSCGDSHRDDSQIGARTRPHAAGESLTAPMAGPPRRGDAGASTPAV